MTNFSIKNTVIVILIIFLFFLVETGLLFPLIAIIIVLFICISFLGTLFSSSNKENPKVEIKNEEAFKKKVIAPEIKANKKSYKIENFGLFGEIKDNFIPEEILDLNDLLYIDIICFYKLDISSILKKNKKLRSLIIKGPFVIENNLKSQIIELRIDNNTFMDSFISNLINFKEICEIHLKLPSNYEKNIEFKDLNFFSLYIYGEIQKHPKITNCNKLYEIYLIDNSLFDFPYEYLNITTLEKLELHNNDINLIDKNLLNTKSNLKYLGLSKNKLKKIPFEIFNLKKIREVALSQNNFSKKDMIKIYSNYKSIVYFNDKEIEVIKRTFSPQTWLTIKLFTAVIISIVPYLFFDSLAVSLLISLFSIFALLHK